MSIKNVCNTVLEIINFLVAVSILKQLISYQPRAGFMAEARGDHIKLSRSRGRTKNSYLTESDT